MSRIAEDVKSMADEVLEMSDKELATLLAKTPGAMIDYARMMKEVFQEVSEMPDNEKENYFYLARAHVALERSRQTDLN